MKTVKPKKLSKGDTVGVVSLSWGGPSVYPKVYKKGIEYIQDVLGLKVKEYPTALADADYLYHHPEVRATDLNNAFADNEVKAIFSTIGGDDSLRLLPYLDPQIALENPKILMGFSDTTISNVFYNCHGLVTFNGPSVMAGLAQANNLGQDYQKHIRDMLFGENLLKGYKYPKFSKFADGYADWKNLENSNKIKGWQNTTGTRWVQGGETTGTLFGGCVEVLEFLKGTKYWPGNDFWEGKILFLETSEDKPTITQLKYFLRNYGLMGVYDKVSAVIFGRARDYSEEEKKELDEMIEKVICEEFGNKKITIVTNMDFGHTDPQIILPLGIEAKLDSDQNTLSLLESPYANN
jgi:muramoyltetrapeptide carboxypeptidase LdcA involved in peptidoglycan recycling